MNTTPTASHVILGLTSQIVSAYLKNNHVAAGELPYLIRQVHAALANAGVVPQAEPEKPAPPAPPKRTIFNDYIICLEDGRKLKTLKRHLNSTYGLSPDQYREKWGLAADYPMVAPSYAARRSSLAKSIGLGRKAAEQRAAAAEPELELALDEPPLPAMPRFIIAPADSPRPAPPPGATHSAQAAARRDTPAAEPTAESVFAKFSAKTPEPEPEPPAPTDTRKAARKPFSKQLARSMRP